MIFAKTPRAGRVKTRLAADIGAAAARDLYCAMLEYTVRSVTRPAVASVVLYVYPDADAPFFQALSSRYPVKLCRQAGRDLGERMANAIDEQMQDADFVILIGSDCLLIDEPYLLQAANRLAAGVPLVFGPADDGGYVMVGMNERHTKIFEDISWGSEKVMAQSRNRCCQLGLRMEELPALFDIDTVMDWQRLQRDYPRIVSQLNNLNWKPENESQRFG